MSSEAQLAFDEFSEDFKRFYDRVLRPHIDLISEYNTSEKYEEARKNPLFFFNQMKGQFFYMQERFEKFEESCEHLDWLLVKHPNLN